MRVLLAELHATVDALEARFGGDAPESPTWQTLVGPLERLSDRHSRTWNVVGHLKGVKDSEALRKAVDEIQPENVKFGLRLSQVRERGVGEERWKRGGEGEQRAAHTTTTLPPR